MNLLPSLPHPLLLPLLLPLHFRLHCQDAQESQDQSNSVRNLCTLDAFVLMKAEIFKQQSDACNAKSRSCLTCCCCRILTILNLLLLTAWSLGREEAVIQPGLKACWLLPRLGLPHPVQYTLHAHTQPLAVTAHPDIRLYTQHSLVSASIPGNVTQPALCSAAYSSKTLPGLCVMLNKMADSCAVNSEKVDSDLGRLLIIFDLTPLHMHLCHSVALLAEVCTGDDIRIPASYSSQTPVCLVCLQNISSICTTRTSHPRCCEGSYADKPRSRRLNLP